MICRSGSQSRSISPDSKYTGVPIEHHVQGLEHLRRGLVKFGFTCVASLDLLVDYFDAVRGRHAHLPDCENTVT